MNIPFNSLEIPVLTTIGMIVGGSILPNTQDFSRFSVLANNASDFGIPDSWTQREVEEIQESLIDFATGKHKKFNTLEEFIEDLHSG